MTVGEFLEQEKLEQVHFHIVQEESDYWQTSGSFILSNWNKEIERLSTKQFAWLERICEDMTEKRIEGKL